MTWIQTDSRLENARRKRARKCAVLNEILGKSGTAFLVGDVRRPRTQPPLSSTSRAHLCSPQEPCKFLSRPVSTRPPREPRPSCAIPRPSRPRPRRLAFLILVTPDWNCSNNRSSSSLTRPPVHSPLNSHRQDDHPRGGVVRHHRQRQGQDPGQGGHPPRPAASHLCR